MAARRNLGGPLPVMRRAVHVSIVEDDAAALAYPALPATSGVAGRRDGGDRGYGAL